MTIASVMIHWVYLLSLDPKLKEPKMSTFHKQTTRDLLVLLLHPYDVSHELLV
jgi:hypothetical protein